MNKNRNKHINTIYNSQKRQRMDPKIFFTTAIATILFLTSCSEIKVKFESDNFEPINNINITIDEKSENTVTLDAKPEGGIALLKNVNFDEGIINLELKGENKPGGSFVGIAFNIQNDSTYECVYFRPFNFKSKEKKYNAIQYISQPKHKWHILRKNFKGRYEANYPKSPPADDWFAITLKIDDKKIALYDKKTTIRLLIIDRLQKQVSNKIGLWTGNNSKGEFKNMSRMK